MMIEEMMITIEARAGIKPIFNKIQKRSFQSLFFYAGENPVEILRASTTLKIIGQRL